MDQERVDPPLGASTYGWRSRADPGGDFLDPVGGVPGGSGRSRAEPGGGKKLLGTLGACLGAKMLTIHLTVRRNCQPA